WLTIVPTVWLLVCTLTAGLQKVVSSAPAIGFVSHAWGFSDAPSAGRVLAPAKSLGEMDRGIFNDYVDATLAALFIAVVVAITVFGLISIRKALGNPQVTAKEVELTGVAAAMGGSHA